MLTQITGESIQVKSSLRKRPTCTDETHRCVRTLNRTSRNLRLIGNAKGRWAPASRLARRESRGRESRGRGRLGVHGTRLESVESFHASRSFTLPSRLARHTIGSAITARVPVPRRGDSERPDLTRTHSFQLLIRRFSWPRPAQDVRAAGSKYSTPVTVLSLENTSCCSTWRDNTPLQKSAARRVTPAPRRSCVRRP